MLDIQKVDSGDYICVASNPSGSTAWKARLSVESPRNPNIHFNKMPHSSMFPEPPSKPFLVNTTETSITIKWERLGSSGTSSHIGSILESYSPDLKDGWMRVARHIQSDIFTVRNLRPNTKYQFIVRAENKHGIGYPSEVSDEIKTLDLTVDQSLNEIDTSQARMLLNDVNIRIKDLRTISSASVKIFWIIQGNVDFIEGYYIRYQDIKNDLQLGNTFDMVTVFGGVTTSHILSDLKKFTQYQFFVIPFYKNIEGKPSNILSAKTYEDVPSAPPYSITAKAINDSCAVIEWTPPPEESQNGRIMGYRFQIFENNTLLHANLTMDTPFNSLVLYNLSSGSFYTVRALAFTSIGDGPFSQMVYLNMDTASDFDGVHLQPSYQSNFFFNPFWFFLFIAIVIIILAVIIFRIALLYTNKRSKPIYEKANSMNENLSDNFPKYDSTSSKYSSCPDNNEYAEVNDLKSYSDNSDKATVAYAMTPLIEKMSEPTALHYDNGRKFTKSKGDDVSAEKLIAEHQNGLGYSGGLMKTTNSANRSNILPKYNSIVSYDQSKEKLKECKLGNYFPKVLNVGARQMSNISDYETADNPIQRNCAFDYDVSNVSSTDCLLKEKLLMFWFIGL